MLLRQFRDLFFDLFHLRHRDTHYIGVVGVPVAEILMMFFGWIKRLQLHHLSDDRRAEHLRLLQLFDVSFGNLLLLGIGVEDRRTVLCAGIWTLPVELGGIVSHVEEHLQYLTVGYLAGVKRDLD